MAAGRCQAYIQPAFWRTQTLIVADPQGPVPGSMADLIPKSLYSLGGSFASPLTTFSLDGAPSASSSFSPKNLQGGGRLMIPAPAEKKKIELYSRTVATTEEQF